MFGNKTEVKEALLARARSGADLSDVEREAERLMRALDLVDDWVTPRHPSPDRTGSAPHAAP